MLSPEDINWLSRKARTYEPSKMAFSCMRGKGCSKEECPAWLNIQWELENTDTGKRVQTPIIGCQFIVNPIFMADMVESAYRNIDRSNEISKKVEKFTQTVLTTVKQGTIAIMKFIGVKNIQNVIQENQTLKLENQKYKNLLEEKTIKETEIA